MTHGQIRRAVGIYRQAFERFGISKRRYPPDRRPKRETDVYRHAYAMLDDIEPLLADRRREEAIKRLSFIQGVLWAHGLFTLNRLKRHNRPPE